MSTKSIWTVLILSAAVMALSGGGCSSSSSSSSGGGGSEFFVQTWSGAAPNTSLAEFLDEADGEKISITQHTGSMTLSEADIDAIVDFLFFKGDLPDLSGSTLAAIGDGSDENPAYFKLTDTEGNDFVFRIDSTGELQMLSRNDEEVDGFIFAVGAKNLDDVPDVGDDVAALVATTPGVDAPHFGTLDYMSAVAWATTGVPDEGATEVMVDFGVGHVGLVTPEADIGDIPADREAHYFGNFVGIYVEPGTGADGFVGVATGHAEFTADFGAATVEGGVHEISIEGITLAGEPGGLEDAGGIDFVDVTIGGEPAGGFNGDAIDVNTFSGDVVPGEGGFADFDEASIGTVDGTFYGPVIDVDVDHMGPAEAGAVLTLNDAASDDFITGVIGAVIDD
jgi:hypothetical protein